mgnify:CR=1 FL=1
MVEIIVQVLHYALNIFVHDLPILWNNSKFSIVFCLLLLEMSIAFQNGKGIKCQ